jgi:Flp pilus assembly CpaF family ATPase
VFALIISEKGGAERRQQFDKAEITIGRLQGNDVTLPKGNVSKTHARLRQRDGAFYVVDENSTNGTYVNRKRISGETAISETDRVYVGDYVLRVEGALGEEAKASAEHPISVAPAAAAAQQVAASPGVFPSLPDLQAHPHEAGMFDPPSSRDLQDKPGKGRVFGSIPPADAQEGKLQGLKLSQPPPPAFAPERSLSSPPGAAINLPPVRFDPAQVASVLPMVRSLVEAAQARFGVEVFETEPSLELRQQVDPFIQVQAQAAATSASDAERLGQLVKNELFEVGPLGALFADRSTTQIIVDGTNGLWVSAAGQHNRLETPFSTPISLNNALRRLCVRAGTDLNSVIRAGDCVLSNGYRLKVLDAHGARLVVALLRVEPVQATFDALVRRGVVSRDMATMLRQCAIGRINVLVVGSRPGRVSELLNALAGSAPQDTWLSIESQDTFLLDQPHVIRVNRSAFASRWHELTRFSAGIPGLRVLVEDLTGDLCASVLQVVAAGQLGVVASVPASTLEVALERLAIQVSASSAGYDARTAERALASSFNLIVETQHLDNDRDQVQRITEMRCRPSDVELIDLFRFDATAGTGPGVVATGNEPTFAKLLRAQGVALDPQLFRKA